MAADNDVDKIYAECIRYLGKLSQKDLVQTQPHQLSQFVGIANYLENIGDVIETDLLGEARKRIQSGTAISPSTVTKLGAIDEQVRRAFDKALAAIETDDRGEALAAIESKEIVNDLAQAATDHLAMRLVAREPGRLEAFNIETDIIENYRRINTYTRRIGRLCLAINNDDADADD
jgi:phosphate:Na+ symporter